ncbi:MAG: exodeoxyribonuclease I [Gammaproteobacteria bacterium]|nr:exodeoxyribonuclease I [Gammaproteobacteria bacterium]
MLPDSFYWIDYETFGANPRMDRPCQFAGIRTDIDFNVIEDPLVLYCKQSDDYLPHPEACLVTGITPQIANANGVCEAEFIEQIQERLIQPGTCTVGYNNIRFDDEVTRHLLYRNLREPYEHEWRNNNSRWDLIDVLRLTCALRPEGIEWPVDDNGNPVFRLEALTNANGIEHGDAHDALADVRATIAMAALVRDAQPRLFEYCLNHRDKLSVFDGLDLDNMEPVVHVSGRIAASRHCLAMVAPVAMHPANKNGIIVYDLAVNPEPLLELDSEEISKRLFTAQADLPESIERIPLKTVHANKCPVIAPVSVLREQDCQRLSIDLSLCRKNLEMLKQHQHTIRDKVSAVFQSSTPAQNADPDTMLYSGGFLGDSDRRKLRHITTIPEHELLGYSADFIDQRLAEMLFRYRARNYPESLTEQEQASWNQFRYQRLFENNPDTETGLDFSEFNSILNELKAKTVESKQLEILDDLEHYGLALKKSF